MIAFGAREAEIEVDEGSRAGMPPFHDRQPYCGLSFDGAAFQAHQGGQDRTARDCTCA